MVNALTCLVCDEEGGAKSGMLQSEKANVQPTGCMCHQYSNDAAAHDTPSVFTVPDCSFSSFEKNFCAWLLICTAVFVPMCSADQKTSQVWQALGCQVQTGTLKLAFDPTPGASVKLKSFQEQSVLVLRPLLPLFRDSIGLPCLHTQLRRGQDLQSKQPQTVINRCPSQLTGADC